MIKKLILRLTPKIIHEKYLELKKVYFYRSFEKQYNVVLKKIKHKEKIKVAFYLFNVDTWKADSVYWALEENEKFIPHIVICPLISKGDEFLNQQFQQCLNLVKRKKYRYIIGFAGDAENTVKPIKIKPFDIVFFLNPNALTIPQYTLLRNRKSLNCYIPYSFNIDNLIEYEYNNKVLNMMFKVFALTDYHQQQYFQYSECKGLNTYVAGFPQLDSYIHVAQSNPWKTPTSHRKKIVWGPHWTIPGLQETGLDWACFLYYADFVLLLADKYKNEIEFALKPHPFLFNLLEKEENWGKEKVEAYLHNWETKENCQIAHGDYIDLFKHSDALIHDSGSFTVEYLCLKKPVAYTINNKNYLNRFNQIGISAINLHYKIESAADFEKFIINVMNGTDPMESNRKTFNGEVLMADGSAGWRIVNHLEKSIT